MNTATIAVPMPMTLPTISPPDRLGVAIFFALIAHAILILGVSFSPDDLPQIGRSTMEIILVPTKSEQAPQKADYLAQANQDGGGQTSKAERPATPLAAPFVAREATVPAVAPPAEPAAAPPEEQVTDKPVLTQAKAERKVQPKPAPRPRVEPVDRPEHKRRVRHREKKKDISAAALITSSLEMASLNAEIDRKLKSYAERPIRKFINARTREYKYAAYMEAWRAKVERVGNLNYPDEARRRKLSGSLLLDVALKPDGSIDDIVLRRSSGHKVLDDAAIRIVRLAAPYAPFPPSIRKEIDILHLERTWQFLNSNQLFAR